MVTGKNLRQNFEAAKLSGPIGNHNNLQRPEVRSLVFFTGNTGKPRG